MPTLPYLLLLLLAPQGTQAAAPTPDAAQSPEAEAPPAAEQDALRSLDFDEDDGSGWRAVDGVMLIINEEIITARRFARDLTRYQSMGGISTREDRETIGRWLMFEKVRRKVMVQAGRDMGLDPLLVERQVDNVLEREIEDAGGVERYVEQVRGERSDSHERKEQWADQMYSMTWEQVQTGESPGPLGRPTHDRYVRPGLRRFVYEQVVDTPTWYGELGGNAPAIEFQELLIAHERHGGAEAARTLADEVREQALKGSSFDDLMRSFGEARADGFVTRADETLVARVDKTLAAFLADAEPGDISRVYAARNGSVPAFAVTRFVGRVAAHIPPFAEPDVQLKIDKRTRENLDQARRTQALEELLRAAYVWPPEARSAQPEGVTDGPQPDEAPEPEEAADEPPTDPPSGPAGR